MWMGLTLTMSIVAPSSAGTELTIYNQGFALVKETRQIQLKKGQQNVAVEDVAAQIEANSVGIKSISAPGSFTVLEQNYQYDLISPWAILNKAVGKKITFNQVHPDGKKERITGTLLSSPTAVVSDHQGNQNHTYNGMVIRTDDGKILLNPYGTVEVAEIPEGLISKPTLLWMIESRAEGSNNIELSYLTRGITWNCDYVLSLDQAGKQGDLKAWVTLNNASGASYKEAKLKLLAGDVMRAPMGDARSRMGAGAFREEAKVAAEPQFAQEAFADYHLYTLQRPASVRNNEIKQVSLLEAFEVKVTKKLIIDLWRNMSVPMPQEGQTGTGPLKPLIVIELKNSKENQLGVPMPMGNFKVYQRDSGGAVQLLGEDSIQHTPKEEKINLKVGRAFDVVGERKSTKFEWVRNIKGNVKGALQTFEWEIRNRKETDEVVFIIERFYGEANIESTDLNPKTLEAGVLEFTVKLKPNEVRKFSYTVKSRW